MPGPKSITGLILPVHGGRERNELWHPCWSQIGVFWRRRKWEVWARVVLVPNSVINALWKPSSTISCLVLVSPLVLLLLISSTEAPNSSKPQACQAASLYRVQRGATRTSTGTFSHCRNTENRGKKRGGGKPRQDSGFYRVITLSWMWREHRGRSQAGKLENVLNCWGCWTWTVLGVGILLQNIWIGLQFVLRWFPTQILPCLIRSEIQEMKLPGPFSVPALREVPKVNAQHKVKHCEAELPAAGSGEFYNQRSQRRNGRKILFFNAF